MKRNLYLAITIIVIAAGCADNKTDTELKKEKLQEYQLELQAINLKIDELQKEIESADPKFANENDLSILVTTLTLTKQPFEHKIEVRGQVESRKNVLISAEIPGKIQTISVKEGQSVRKGQI